MHNLARRHSALYGVTRTGGRITGGDDATFFVNASCPLASRGWKGTPASVAEVVAVAARRPAPRRQRRRLQVGSVFNTQTKSAFKSLRTGP